MPIRLMAMLLVAICAGPSCAPQKPPQQAARPQTAFACPAPNGKWSHDECTKYWECHEGVPYEMSCGLMPWYSERYYHPGIKGCLEATLVQCEPGNPGL